MLQLCHSDVTLWPPSPPYQVALLKAQVEQLQNVRFAREGGKCGLEAPCSQSLEAMEKAHREVLEELQRRHEREVRELEAERDRLLREEAQATAQGEWVGNPAWVAAADWAAKPLRYYQGST